MLRYRLLVCILLAITLVIYAVPALPFQGELEMVLFSTLWILFALLSVGGNVISLLYQKK